MDYLKLLKESYIKAKLEDDTLTPHEFLGACVFEFTTYDGGISDKMSRIALPICLAITERTTFDFIEDEDNYLNYITYANTDFFSQKLEWGTSIRGAWWDLNCNRAFELDGDDLYLDGERMLNLKFNNDDWDLFVYAMRDFVLESEENK